MRLSEAIRLGAMLGPQAHGDLQRPRRKYLLFGPLVSTSYCALGAAFAAVGATNRQGKRTEAGVVEGFRGVTKYKAGETYTYVDTPDAWTRLLWRQHDCPQCGSKQKKPVMSLIPHLNDDHKWTRESIASWVESIEQQREESGTRHDGHEAATPEAAVVPVASK